ncbi:MAG: hypothetical protein V1798_02075 [Pseudomonadota bacterium]
MTARSFLALALAVSLSIDPAWLAAADSEGRVFVYFAVPSAKEHADRLTAQLTKDGIDTVEKSPAAADLSADEALTNEGSTLLRKAKELFKNLRFQAASSALKRARQNADAATLRETFFVEALVGQATGNLRGMNKAMENYAVMNGPRPDEGYYAPAVLQAYDQARRKVVALPVAALDIRPQVAAAYRAEIFLDGSRVGLAPMLVTSGYRVGPHHVAISARGYQTYQRFVLLGSKGLTLAPALVPLSPASLVMQGLKLPSPRESQQMIAWAQASASSRGIVVVEDQALRVFKGGLETWSSPLESGAPLPANTSDRIREALFGAAPTEKTALTPVVNQEVLEAAEASSKREATLGLEPATATKSQSWYQKWWVWTLIGAAAAAGGTTYFLMRNSGSADTVHVTVNAQ